jgi:hypothetical protein
MQPLGLQHLQLLLLTLLLVVLLLPAWQPRPCVTACESIVLDVVRRGTLLLVGSATRGSKVLHMARPTCRSLTIQRAPVYGRQSSY